MKRIQFQVSKFTKNVLVQPLENLYGLRPKNVWVYIDFENISISLNEQGFVVNLDHLIERFVSQAQAHGRLVKMSAYAPLGAARRLAAIGRFLRKRSGRRRAISPDDGEY